MSAIQADPVELDAAKRSSNSRVQQRKITMKGNAPIITEKVIECVVASANGLKPMDSNGFSDPYVKIYLKKENGTKAKCFQTSVRKKTLDPTWNEDFQVSVQKSDVLIVKIFDKDVFQPDDYLGFCELSISELGVQLADHDEWIKNTYSVSNGTGKISLLFKALSDLSDWYPTAFVHHLDLELEGSKIEHLHKIGAGSFGCVYKGKWKGKDVAVKTIAILNKTHTNEVLSEVSLMNQLKHPNIVSYYGYLFTQSSDLAIVMEYATKGNLHEVLHNNQDLSWSLQLMISIHVARAIRHLHNNNPPVLHRDLKSLNVLIGEDWQPKLSDFGVSKLFLSTGAENSKMGTINWMAPEVLSSLPYTTKADIYSFGMILWEILTHKIPFRKKALVLLLREVIAGVRPKIPPSTPLEYSSLIEDCWQPDPQKRPMLDEVLTRIKGLYFKMKMSGNEGPLINIVSDGPAEND